MRITVVGVGLIGGSIGMAARRGGAHVVTGWDRCAAALRQAHARAAIDIAAGGLPEALAGAEIAFVAVPVGALVETVAAVLAAAPRDCVVSDVGSTKRLVCAAHDDPRFVGGHPLAGAETAGVEHARGDLFEGATWYLTPSPATSGLLLDRLFRFLRATGARPQAIEAELHDRTLAAVSHLPHVLANVLVSQAAGALGEAEQRIPATGPSFRDATRVAGAPGSVWTDIYLSNADALVEQLDATIARLEGVREALRDADRRAIVAWNDAAREDRRRLLEAGLAGEKLCELRVTVPNRPGVLAQLALGLGRGGVNIVDMALHPAPDMSEGVLAVWVGGDEDGARAQELIEGLGFPVVVA
jgi:prephenate dehydrogenase